MNNFSETQITRRMAYTLNELEDNYKILYSDDDFIQKMEYLDRVGRSGRPSVLAGLYKMFDATGIEYKKNQSNDYYIDLIRKADIPGFKELNHKFLLALYSHFQEYPSPQQYMKRLVDRLSDSSDHWENDTLRVRILKQFLKYGGDALKKSANIGGKAAVKKLVKAKLGKEKLSEGEILDNISDEIFGILETAKADQLKPGGSYGLLKIADDLAGGKFHTGSATKKALFLFAMVYGMTYDSEGDEADWKRTDVEINLFHDYYTNNMMRYLTDIYKNDKDAEQKYEKDPSGIGINYKNFAEIIYLYYIAKDCSPKNKIEKSAEMIERLKQKHFKKGKPQIDRIDQTIYYRNLVAGQKTADTGWGTNLFSESIMQLDEADFEQFISDNYNCDTYTGQTVQVNGKPQDVAQGPLELENDQNTASREYNRIIDKLNGLVLSGYNNLYPGVKISDLSLFKKDESYKTKYAKKYGINDTDKFGDFIELLKKIDIFLQLDNRDAEIQSKAANGPLLTKKVKKFKKISSNNVSRTKLLAAFSCWYIENDHNRSRQINGTRMTFREVFDEFKIQADGMLQRCNYQELNGKNIFDVVIAFSAYARQYI